MLGRYKSSVATRIILWIVIFSIVACTMVTAVQVYFEHQSHVSRIQSQIGNIERSYISSIRRALWIQDLAQLQMLADGIEAAPEIAFVSISENNKPLATAGKLPANNGLVWDKEITFDYRSTAIEIGRLEIVGDLDVVHSRMTGMALTMLATNMSITLAIAVFVYFIFSHLVTAAPERHCRPAERNVGRGPGDRAGAGAAG